MITRQQILQAFELSTGWPAPSDTKISGFGEDYMKGRILVFDDPNDEPWIVTIREIQDMKRAGLIAVGDNQYLPDRFREAFERLRG
jgi:hypothetical protein